MSNLTSTSAMVAQLQTRVPIGLSSTFWMAKLNEAYRWISQKGNFIWDLKEPSVVWTLSIGDTRILLPTDCDPGKPIYISGPTASSGVSTTVLTTIPFKAWDESLDQQYADVVAPPGLFSCFTVVSQFRTNPFAPFNTLYEYLVQFYPASAAPTIATGDFTFKMVYHADVASTEYALGANVFFPTPNSFDNLLIELAEAEARRIYGLAGWDIIQKRAESAIVNLLDSYRSTKNVLSGLVDQQKQASEKQMMAQERA